MPLVAAPAADDDGPGRRRNPRIRWIFLNACTPPDSERGFRHYKGRNDFVCTGNADLDADVCVVSHYGMRY